jgi:hypothetical protein
VFDPICLLVGWLTYLFLGGSMDEDKHRQLYKRQQQQQQLRGALRRVKMNDAPISFAHECAVPQCKHAATRGYFLADATTSTAAAAAAECMVRQELQSVSCVRDVEVLEVLADDKRVVAEAEAGPSWSSSRRKHRLSPTTKSSSSRSTDSSSAASGGVNSTTSSGATSTTHSICLVHLRGNERTRVPLCFECAPADLVATTVREVLEQVLASSSSSNNSSPIIADDARLASGCQSWWCDGHAPSWAWSTSRPSVVAPVAVKAEEAYVGMPVTVASLTSLQLQLRAHGRRDLDSRRRALLATWADRPGVVVARLKDEPQVLRVQLLDGRVVSVPAAALHLDKARHIQAVVTADAAAAAAAAPPTAAGDGGFGATLPEVYDPTSTSKRLSAAVGDAEATTQSAVVASQPLTVRVGAARASDVLRRPPRWS